MIERKIKPQIIKWLYRNKVIIIYGARRTGKTTLAQSILDEQTNQGKKCIYINCELLNAKQSLETTNDKLLKNYLGNNDLVVLDEAQNIHNIGLILKIIVDTFPEIQIIATGSSSFDLANKINEPLTGRCRQYILYPLSLTELKDSLGFHNTVGQIDKIIQYGLYPGVFSLTENDARTELIELASNYLYKDVLAFEQVKSPKMLVKLLTLLALQVGNEVSLRELAQNLEISAPTVKRYIDLLEKTFVIFSLGSFSRNLRNEIHKSQKIYFYDLGIRNSIIQNFNKPDLRQDIGALWENFCIIERLKYNQSTEKFVNQYFWRMYSGQEVDYIEEHSGLLDGFEFKYNAKAKFKKPKAFLEGYKNSSVQIIHRDNWFEHLI